jgi:peptidoglycan/LPS O-acetylase OafA/YrhL
MDPEVIIPVVAIVFPIGGSVAAVLLWMSLNYRKRRRLIELHHIERMAAIERGMDVPPLPVELIAGRPHRRRRSSLLPGLVWFFIGLAIAGGMALGNDEDMPWMIGLIPLGIGAAYLIYYFVEGRNVEGRLLEHELASRNGRASNQAATPSL